MHAPLLLLTHTHLVLTNLVHEAVLGQYLPHGPAPGHHVEHALGQPRLGTDLGEQEGGEPRVGGGLEDHSVTHGEGGRHLPDQEHEGEVPGDDGPDHPDTGPAPHLLVHELGPARVVIEVPHHHGRVGVTGLADGFPIVKSLDNSNQSENVCLPCLLPSGHNIHLACFWTCRAML